LPVIRMQHVKTVDDLMQRSGVAFGTSGARGLVSAMSDEVCFAYITAFLQYLNRLGEFPAGGEVAVAGDLRPSTPRILAACCRAIEMAGGRPVFCGYVPSPALAFFGFRRRIPSLMVTGSHIPDDRNGIKFNRVGGEILKSDEEGIRVQGVRLPEGLFESDGRFVHPPALPAQVDVDVETPFVRRYADYLGDGSLQGLRVGVYQHSAVGRDLLIRVLSALGATVLPLARSDRFIPVDTEAIRSEDIALAREWARQHRLDAIVSTDGDSDRPLVADEMGEWLRGDVVGVLCARFVGATCVVTPVSSNTALEKSAWFATTRRTRIGSPYVIQAMTSAQKDGEAVVCGYEANGGFLLGSPVERNGETLAPLPTRDAVLPILAVLALARKSGCRVSALLASLPQRFTYSDRLRDFPTELSQRKLAELWADGDEGAQRAALESLLASTAGEVVAIDGTDGLRVTFSSDEIIHLRPSGNAPELRCYTEAGSTARAEQLNRAALARLSTWRQTP